jgi:hypothetical protein
MAARNTGALPFSAHACYTTCIYLGLSISSDVQMRAPAKTRIGRGWDLVSQICCSETHRTAARNTGALPVSALALMLCNLHVSRAAGLRICGDARMLSPAKQHNG